MIFQLPDFQAALDAAQPNAVLVASDYSPFLKNGIYILKPVTIVGGVFVAGDEHGPHGGRSRMSIDGSEPPDPALRILDQDLVNQTDQVTLRGSYVFGFSDIRFDRLVLEQCRIYGDLRCYPGTQLVELTDTLVQADQEARRGARAGIGAQGAIVTVERSLVRGGRSQRCPSDGAPAVRSAVIGFDTLSRLRGGRGRCGGANGAWWEARP